MDFHTLTAQNTLFKNLQNVVNVKSLTPAVCCSSRRWNPSKFLTNNSPPRCSHHLGGRGRNHCTTPFRHWPKAFCIVIEFWLHSWISRFTKTYQKNLVLPRVPDTLKEPGFFSSTRRERESCWLVFWWPLILLQWILCTDKRNLVILHKNLPICKKHLGKNNI